MVQKRLYFLVGLFVTIGILLGVAAIIWLGASKYFQKGAMYATYFDESVQGLQVDSVVKFRGVDIGTVRKIEVAPDQRLIEVVMKIDVKNFNVSGVVAKLTLAGITGIVYVELDRRKPGEVSLTPATFKPPYPVIPSAPSNIREIEAGINEVMRRVKEIDFAGMSAEVMKAAKSIDSFVNSEQMRHAIRDAGAASARLADAADRVDRLLAGGRVDEAVANADEAAKEARKAIAEIRTQVAAANVARTSANVDSLIRDTSGRVDTVLSEFELTAESLRRTADSLQELADRLRANPSALIFSRPPKGE